MYRRIAEIEPSDNTHSKNNSGEDTLGSAASKQQKGKRKLPESFDERQQRGHLPIENQNILSDEESDSQDEVHLFRRVHIKPRRGTFWTVVEKQPSLEVQGHGLDLKFDGYRTWDFERETVTVARANKSFDPAFCYFEIEILHLAAARIEGWHGGYVTFANQ